MFVKGTVNVTRTSPPKRDAVITSTAAGIRTKGASGGPFTPQPHPNSATARTTAAAPPLTAVVVILRMVRPPACRPRVI